MGETAICPQRRTLSASLRSAAPPKGELIYSCRFAPEKLPPPSGELARERLRGFYPSSTLRMASFTTG